ncbi:hypothetical protein H4S14_004106 [Agrobacterium vitis]|nr:hypothetical protein [Agrobacterium vitis]MBE1440332.1 hypothetical protein [Agrobacterium vitis]
MTSKTTNKFSPEVGARAVRMVTEHEAEHPSRWAAVSSIAAKIGCSAHTLHEWVKKAEVDSGSQYVSIRYSERLPEAGIEPSVGSVGDSYDNALAEAINGLYKAEVIYRRGSWCNFEAVEFATLEWVDWFNHRRLLQPIGNIPPAEAEERYDAMLDAPAMVA